ncbi:uncharacterized protein I206_102936 [Kwoniella pini CBS 10737]|uniref:[histone H3]-trimethyl-L-lysine(9) demethylase n=1 Tax=Kwoniella pini CBS 10737 TaxID=1296096 RepID=A0A1B9I713_9TREE|nr:uncharacterized protein I206_03287 [Kwoniella pini CBS 10737]OCF51221.1 hypothetical protein I206_03287 [Kwoniella pini CBS 10737]
MSSPDIGDQIIVDLHLPPPPVQPSSNVALNPICDTHHSQEAGPSTRRKKKLSDTGAQMNGTNGHYQDKVPKVEVTMDERPTYIQPDHFYPTTNHPNQAAIARNIPKIGDGPLSPEDDPQALRGIPVFKPTMEEFQDFEAYATATTAWGQYSGIVKIIPPEEWKSTLPPISKSTLSRRTINTPIQQNFLGASGLFKVANVPKNKNRPLSMKEWFNKCHDKKFLGIGPKDVGKTLNRDSKEAIEWRARKNAEIKQAKEDKKRKNAERKARKEAAATGTVDVDVNEAIKQESMDLEVKEELELAVPALDPSSTSSHSSPEPTHPTTPKTESESEDVEPWYKSFNPSTDWLPKDTTPEDYTPETCAALERHLWKNMGLGEPSWYGADMEGSLFVDDKTPWNVAHLPNLLNRWDLRHLPGVNAPYLYFGMWGASFAWHVEDMDLFSINYIHFGAPKYWYAVPQLQAEKFERILQGYFPEDSRHCDQFLRHKAFAVSPHRLANDGVHVNMLVHNQGEFVITYPRGYHAGFNMGFNCAESVNFALDSWVELGRRAKACQCVTHSVHIDVDEMIAKEEKRMNGEQELLDAIKEERQQKRSRKRTTMDQGVTPRKRAKREVGIINEPTEDDANASMEAEEEQMNAEPKEPVMRKRKPKSIIDLSPTRPRLSPAIIKESPTYPCLFCPLLSTEGLLPILEATETVKSMWKPRKEEIRIHHQCALAMPGVGIEDKEVEGKTKTYVVGLENIEMARWNLKCGACADKRLAKSGAKIQCTKGKCPKAYHVSCAQEHEGASLKIWEVEIPIMPGEDEKPPLEGEPIPVVKDIKVELLCPQHNPDMKAQIEAKKAEKFKQKIMAIPLGSKVKIKARGGASLELILNGIRESTQDVLVQDDVGQTAIYPWSSIDFRPAVMRTENEYARVHTHTRKISAQEPTTSATNGLEATHAIPQPAPLSISRLVLHPPKANTDSAPSPARIAPALPAHRAPLRVEQMLNPRSDTPSRVVLCEDPRIAQFPINAHASRRNPQLQAEFLSDRQPMRLDGHDVPVQASTMSGQHHVASTQAQPRPVEYAVPYRSRSPYRHPIAPFEADHRYGYHQAGSESRRSSLTDRPPPFPMHTGFPVPLPPSVLIPPSSHAAPLANYATFASRAGGLYPTPPSSSSSGRTIYNGSSQADQSNHLTANHTTFNGSTTNGMGKIDLGLQRMQTLMKQLQPLSVPAIHLAGTNGKGSVSAILESCLMAGGMNVGRYNSPHLIEPRDAIRINGQPPSRQAYNDAMSIVQDINQRLNIQATTFEIATTAAYYILNTMQPPLDVLIIECGMGGLRDATNVIPDQIKLISGLTSVGLDHTSFLGDTVYAIAAEKSQIVPLGGALVVAPQVHQDALKAAQSTALQKKATVIQAYRSEEIPLPSSPITLKPFTPPQPRVIRTLLPDFSGKRRTSQGKEFLSIDTELSLGGDHQLDNLSVALTILHTLRSDRQSIQLQPKLAGLNDRVIQLGVKRTEWAGRCSWLTYKALPLLVDGSHNSDSAEKLRDYIDKLNFIIKPKIRFIISLSSSPGKSIESVLRPLLRYEDEVICTEFSTPIEGMPWIKTHSMSDIAGVCSTLVGKNNVKFGGNGLEGLKAVLDNLVLQQSNDQETLNVVCGSLYGVADVYRLLC